MGLGPNEWAQQDPNEFPGMGSNGLGPRVQMNGPNNAQMNGPNRAQQDPNERAQQGPIGFKLLASDTGVRACPYGMCCPRVRGGWDLEALGNPSVAAVAHS